MSKVEIDEYEFADTIRPADIKEVLQVTIKSNKTISTRYGVKRVIMIDLDKKERQVFLNAFSIKNLVKEFSDESENWNGKIVNLNVEKSDRTQQKPSIVLSAIKPEKVK